MTRQGVSDKENGIAQGAKTFWRLLSLAAAMSWVAGCGGGGASQPVTMVSITVTPTNASIQASATQQFTATGVFSDSSTEDMTKSVSWTSSDASRATIQNSGLATTDHSSEPYPYKYGYSVKWLIQAQILQIRSVGASIDPTAGDLNYNAGAAPWTAWGPYTWANGDTPRSDGLFWCNGQANAPCSGEVDFQPDGTHPNTQGDQKVANLLMNFSLNSPYTPWFRP